MTNMQDVTFHDDSFDFNPDAVQAPQQFSGGGNNAPEGVIPDPGYYEVKVVAGGVKTDRDTGAVLRDKKDRPIFAIQRIAITEPAEAATSLAIWQDIYTNGFQPKNWKTGETMPGPKTFPFVNLLKAIDDTLPTADFNENVHELAKQLAAKPVIRVRLGLYATDVDYAKAQIAAGMDKKAAYKAAEMGPKMFRNADGSWRKATTGPSGQLIEARCRITEYVPSSDTSKTLGPLTRG